MVLFTKKVCVSIFLATPDDYVMELYADMPRSAWRWHNGKLLRSYTPLMNFDSFVDIDQENDDHGTPAETGIGHIDLYVENIEAAERFYCDFLGHDRNRRQSLAAGHYHQHIVLRKHLRGVHPIGLNYGLVGYRLEVPGMETLYELRKRLSLFGYEDRMVSFHPGMMRLLDPCGWPLDIYSADCGAHTDEQGLEEKVLNEVNM